MIIGSHVSFGSEQILGSVKEALEYGANTFMFYTGAPQNTVRKEINMNLVEDAKKMMIENGVDISNVVCHAPYIINLANREKEDAWNFSCSFLKEEIKRVEKMGVSKIVVHPGNSLKMDRNIAIDNIASALNMIIDKNSKVTILLETMAGKGTECGKTIEELKSIIEKIEVKERVGICLDTCHLNDAGYDIRKFDEIISDIDKLVGLDKVGCIHINDSKNPLASHKDRHENIGYGTIGFDSLLKVVYHDKFKDIPKILETPYIDGKAPYKEEIAMIKRKMFNNSLK